VFKRAVVALDGSPVAEAIVPFILEIAGPLDMEVVLVRVNRPIPPEIIEGSRHVTLEDQEASRLDAEEYLAPVAIELRKRGVRARTQVRRGQPVDEIVAAARETGADLIAMTTHGRSGLGRLLFGSVAEAVLRESQLPLFLMRVTEAQVAARAVQVASP
jgi:nucleotide-binding universal stress UspA family protein